MQYVCIYWDGRIFLDNELIYIYIYDVRHSHSPFSLDNENEGRTLKRGPETRDDVFSWGCILKLKKNI